MAESSVEKLMAEDLWGAHPQYIREVWKAEVAAGDTQRGYWDWVEAQIEESGENED